MKRAVSVLVFLVLAIAVSASAATMHTDLVGGVPPLPKTNTTISLDASAVLDPGTGLWTYTYVIDPTNAMISVTGFSVANLPHMVFYDSTNNKNFVNPAWANFPSSVYWQGGSVLPANGPIIFSFTSPFEPTVVICTLHGGTKTAVGQTLGMIPEPVSLCALGALMAGGVAAIRRRRK